MKLTKKKQLRARFKNIITRHLTWKDCSGCLHKGETADEDDIRIIIDKLIYETELI